MDELLMKKGAITTHRVRAEAFYAKLLLWITAAQSALNLQKTRAGPSMIILITILTVEADANYSGDTLAGRLKHWGRRRAWA